MPNVLLISSASWTLSLLPRKKVDCTIPHYHALEATNAIKEAFPEHYLYDPTPLPQATWRLATQCVEVEKRGDMHVFVN